jgi:hypothetical protein
MKAFKDILGGVTHIYISRLFWYLNSFLVFPAYHTKPLKFITSKISPKGHAQWLMPVIPATQEAAIRRIEVRAQTQKKVSKTPSQSISRVQ